jgi:ferredoxin-NADP reductase
MDGVQGGSGNEALAAQPAPRKARSPQHRALVLGADMPARSTLALRLSRPAGFTFRPGQAIDVDLGEAGRHAFSLASAPFESELLVATRMRASPYKGAMAALRPGDSVGIDGPFGALVMHRSPARDAVFLAGGIGITPFRSMIRQAARDRDARRMTLVYANRAPDDAAFLDELVRLGNGQGPFRLIATMTDMPSSVEPWHGRHGVIDAAVIQEASQGLASPVFYVVGPPGMVAAAREALAQAGIEDDDIRGEEFYGY